MKKHLGTWLASPGNDSEPAPLRQLGWAFLLAWVFCVFYTNAAGVLSGDAASGSLDGLAATSSTSTSLSSIGTALFYAVLPLAASVATLVAIVLAEPRIGAPTSHRALIIAAPLLTAASTPFMFASVADPALNALLFGIGAVATGIGSALLWVMWGEYYAVISRDRSESLAPASAVSAAIIVLLVSAMDGWVPIAVASALPLLSGLCFHLAWTPEANHAEAMLASASRSASGKRRPLAGLERTGFGILVVFSIVSIAGMMGTERIESAPLQAILLFSALMMAVVAAVATSGPRRMSLFFLYRWICPTLVVGLAAVILFGNAGAVIAAAVSIGGRFTFCLIAQIYFANYAAAGRATPAQASSLGWLFVHAGDLLGVALWISLEPTITAQPTGLTTASVTCIVVLVAVTMAVMGEASAFLHIPEHVAPNQVLASSAAAEPSKEALAVTGAFEAESSEEPRAAAPQQPAPQNASPEPFPLQPTSSPTTDEEQDKARVNGIAQNAGLTPREAEVFALLAQGRSIPYIRDELIISRETAATHAKHIYAKLGVHSRQELIDLVRQ